MKTGDTMRFCMVLAEAEDDTTIVVDTNNHLIISGPDDLGCGVNAFVKVLDKEVTVDGRPLVWVRVLEDTTTEDDFEAIISYLDGRNIWWGWEKKTPKTKDGLTIWSIRKEKKNMNTLPLYRELETLPVGIYRIQVQEGYDLHYIGDPNASMVNDLAAQAQVSVTDGVVGVRQVFVTKDAPVEEEAALYAAKAWLLDSFHSHQLKWVWCKEDQMYMLVVLPGKGKKV